jgi:hypothetical protein
VGLGQGAAALAPVAVSDEKARRDAQSGVRFCPAGIFVFSRVVAPHPARQMSFTVTRTQPEGLLASRTPPKMERSTEDVCNSPT